MLLKDDQEKSTPSVIHGEHENSVEYEDTTSSSVITEPFKPEDVNITVKTLSIDSLVRRIRYNEIDLTTYFQRLENLWNITTKSRLIESLLIRLPLPAFYFDGTEDNHWLVVDGLQRLFTLKTFIIDNSLRLQNLEYLPQFKDYTYIDLPRDFQRRIEETQILAYVIQPGTPRQVKLSIFKRINTGMLTLSPQEIRHAVYSDTAASPFVLSLAKSIEFIEATQNSVRPNRMDDGDFLLRALAFILTPYESYKPDLDQFLNSAMDKIANMSEPERNSLESTVKYSLKAAEQIFGIQAFRKQAINDNKLRPLNKALFETWVSTLSYISEEKVEVLIKKKEQLNNLFIELMDDSDFVRSISTGTGQERSVRTRHATIAQIIRKII